MRRGTFVSRERARTRRSPAAAVRALEAPGAAVLVGCAVLVPLAWGAHARSGTYGDKKTSFQFEVSRDGTRIDSFTRLCMPRGTWGVHRPVRVKGGKFVYVGPAVAWSPSHPHGYSPRVRIEGHFVTPNLAVGRARGGPCGPISFKAGYGVGIG